MGSALLAQWARGSEAITVVNPSPRAVPEGVRLVNDIASLEGETFDCIVAGVKPQMLEEVMPPYALLLAEGGYVLSIAAGFAAKRLSALMRGAPVVRTMPNLPAAIGQGVSGLCAGEGVARAQMAHAEQFMRRAGTVITVDSEDRLDRVTVVAGCGPGYVFEIARTYVAAAMAQGFTEAEARSMVLSVIGGSIAMAAEPDAPSFEDLRNSVTSKGGVTAEGLQALNGDGELTRRFQRTLEAAYERAVQLR